MAGIMDIISNPQEGLLGNKGLSLRDLKEMMGAQFTESEGNTILGLPNSVQNEVTTEQDEYIRSLKAKRGASFTEKEAEREAIQQYPKEGWTNMGDSPEVQQFINSLPQPLMMRVEEIRNSVSVEDFRNFINQMMSGQIPEGAVFESLPNSQEGANLGFTAPQYAQGSQFYNHELGAFMPSSYEGGYSGRTGDERYKQGGALGTAPIRYPHQNAGYESQQRYIPLNFGYS